MKGREKAYEEQQAMQWHINKAKQDAREGRPACYEGAIYCDYEREYNKAYKKEAVKKRNK